MGKSLITGFFVPAVFGMKKLKYAQKFALISGIIFLLVGIVLYSFISNINPQIEFNAKENLGVEYIKPVKDVLADFQRFRYAESNGSADAASIKDSIQKEIKQVDEVDSRLHTALLVDKKWDDIKAKWNSLKDSKYNFDETTALINDTIAFISHLTDKSNLTLDPELDTYYLMDGFGFKLPDNLERISLAKFEGLKLLNRSTTNSTEAIKIMTLIENNNNLLNGAINVVYGTRDSLKPVLDKDFNEAFNANNDLIKLMNTIAAGGSVSNADYIDATNRAFEGNKKLYDIYTTTLHELINNRVKKYADQVPVTVFWSIFGLLAIFYIFAGFYFSVTQIIYSVQKSSAKVAEGDLTVKIEVDTKDEMLDLAGTLNHIFNSLRTVVGQVGVSIENVTCGTKEMNMAVEQTAEGTQQVAKSVSQLATGAQDQVVNVSGSLDHIHKISKVVQEISENSHKTVELSKATEQNAVEGRKQAEVAVGKINQIKQTASEVAISINDLGKLSVDIEQIVDLIKGIAGQTNLLALNAAIEAARAGEHGKGFAVVADEVKKLAEQSAKATDEITNMIKQIQTKTKNAVISMNEAVHEVGEGVVIVEKTGITLDEILQAAELTGVQVEEISTKVSGLATNSDNVVRMMENITSIAEGSSALAEEISAITEEQTAAIEEISANSNELARVAENLKSQISIFKV